VLAAIDTLPPEQQQAVRLHYIDGLTLWEIGLLAGVPVGTANEPEVLTRGCVSPGGLQPAAEAQYQSFITTGKGPEMKWRSFRALL
jgi:hypothetical protein